MIVNSILLNNADELNKEREPWEPKPTKEYIVKRAFFDESSIFSALELEILESPIQPVIQLVLSDKNTGEVEYVTAVGKAIEDYVMKRFR